MGAANVTLKWRGMLGVVAMGLGPVRPANSKLTG